MNKYGINWSLIFYYLQAKLFFCGEDQSITSGGVLFIFTGDLST